MTDRTEIPEKSLEILDLLAEWLDPGEPGFTPYDVGDLANELGRSRHSIAGSLSFLEENGLAFGFENPGTKDPLVGLSEEGWKVADNEEAEEGPRAVAWEIEGNPDSKLHLTEDGNTTLCGRSIPRLNMESSPRGSCGHCFK